VKLEIDIESFIEDNTRYDESVIKFLLSNSLNKSKFFINPYTQELERDIKRQIISCLIENHWLHEDVIIIKLIRGNSK